MEGGAVAHLVSLSAAEASPENFLTSCGVAPRWGPRTKDISPTNIPMDLISDDLRLMSYCNFCRSSKFMVVDDMI